MKEKLTTTKISDSVHKKLKKYLVGKPETISQYIDKAVVSQMKSDRISDRVLRQSRV